MSYIDVKYVEVFPGSDINHLVENLIERAKKERVCFKFEFNGTEVKVFSWSNIQDILNKYWETKNGTK